MIFISNLLTVFQSQVNIIVITHLDLIVTYYWPYTIVMIFKVYLINISFLGTLHFIHWPPLTSYSYVYLTSIVRLPSYEMLWASFLRQRNCAHRQAQVGMMNLGAAESLRQQVNHGVFFGWVRYERSRLEVVDDQWWDKHGQAKKTWGSKPPEILWLLKSAPKIVIIDLS